MPAFPLVPILIGLFSFPEIIKMLETEGETFVKVDKPSKMVLHKKDLAGNTVNTIRSILIGIGIGIIPAAGPDIAAFFSYNEAKKNSKHPEMFGKGATDGIIASECANNAVTGGSLIPLLSPGYPWFRPRGHLLGRYVYPRIATRFLSI